MQQPTRSDGNRKPPGRGFVISGIVLIVLSVLGVVVAAVVFGSRVDLDGFSRDVAIAGTAEQNVPGQVGFRVIESVSSDRDTMSVGVALSTSSTSVDCEILTVQGEPAEVRRGSSGDTFISPDIDTSWTVAVVADDLAPGEYSATCDGPGEPSSDQFTVGRIVTVSEVFDTAGPLFGVLAGVVIGGLLGLVGVILLVVGLVVGNRAKRRSPPSWPQGEGRTPGDGGPWTPQSPGPPPWSDC